MDYKVNKVNKLGLISGKNSASYFEKARFCPNFVVVEKLLNIV
jgi:hypothetical protein